MPRAGGGAVAAERVTKTIEMEFRLDILKMPLWGLKSIL